MFFVFVDSAVRHLADAYHPFSNGHRIPDPHTCHTMDGSHGRQKVDADAPLPDVQVFLSRTAYPLGGTVVGTILIQPQNLPGKPASSSSLRSQLKSVTVYAAGFCKIDSRWHDYKMYTKIYGKMHPYIQLMKRQGSGGQFDADLLEQSEDTVCFWATNGMEALDLPERTVGRRWNNIETDFQCGLEDDDLSSNRDIAGNDDGSEYDDESSASKDILAFTFRVDIPFDLPHSVNATTCRYFYTANILVKTDRKQQILKRSFQVVTSSDSDCNVSTIGQHRARVKFGSCIGMAHSNGFPCHLSATEIHRPKGQLMVIQNHCLVEQYHRNKDVQTVRVSNASGRPVCILTIIGSQSLTPGSRIHLQWDFPKGQYYNNNHISSNNDEESWIACHQVSACLRGEEFAIYEDGSKKRTQSFLLDTCHEWVDAGVTGRVSKTLWLGSSSGDGSNTSQLEGGTPPCDLCTDIMEVSTWCQVDITVQEEQNGSENGRGSYNNLSLRIPCRVRHNNTWNEEHEAQDMMEQRIQPLNELLGLDSENIDFPTNDIRSDLKNLSLKMDDILFGNSRTFIETR